MYTEIKYLNLLSVRLEKFKQKKDYLWNFRCPICGDSQRNKNKARGFIYQVKGKPRYKCHNCGSSLTFDKFLEGEDPVLYKQYKLEKFQDSNKPRVDTRKVKRVVSTKPVFKKSVLNELVPVDRLNKEHPAREYLLTRKLPTEALYYTEKFQEWVNSVKPNTFPDTQQDEPRIIIPFINKEGVCFGFQGRSLSPVGLRYITILIDEEQPKIFGLDKIDNEKTIYICEGPFDSLIVENCLAMAGADVGDLGNLGDNVVYIYDNEPRNREICTRISKCIDRGLSVVIWPNNIKDKDINDMHLSGIDVNQVIQLNTFKGLTATLKFNDWTKV